MRGHTASIARLETFETAAPRERLIDRSGAHVETVQIARILWRRRRWIGLAALFAVAGALAYCLLATPQYTAAVQILIDPRDKQVVSNDVNPSAIAADGGLTQVESQGSVLQSSGVLLRAIAATHLDRDSEFNGSGFFSAVTRFFTLFGKTPDPDQMAENLKAETLINLRKHMVVKRAEKVLVLDLALRANTPDRAAAIANAIADAYLVDQADARADNGRAASKALGARLEELRANVRQAEDAVEDYRAKNNFVVSSGQLVNDQEINQTTTQLSAAQNRAASLKAQLDQLRHDSGAQGTPEAIASGVMVRLRDRESAIVEKLSSAGKQLGPLHPEIASLQQSLHDVRALVANETQRLRQAAEADYARAAADERALSKKLDAMKSKSLDDNKADVHLRELQRQAEATRSIYQAYMVRAKETLEASNVDSTNSRIITRALRPQQKSWPPSLLLLLAATLGGLSLGASGSLAHEYLKPTLLDPTQARDLIDAPVAGVIAARDLEGPRAPSRLQEARTQSPDNVARTLLRAMNDSASSDTPACGRVVHFVSPPSTTQFRARIAERVAAMAGREGREVLLVDADLAEVEESERSGLLDVFRGELSISGAVYRQAGESFSRLAKGRPDPEESATRQSADAFRLRRLRRGYDVVVLDAGSMAQNQRLAALAPQADLLVLVAVMGARQSDLKSETEFAGLNEARFDALVLIDPSDDA